MQHDGISTSASSLRTKSTQTSEQFGGDEEQDPECAMLSQASSVADQFTPAKGDDRRDIETPAKGTLPILPRVLAMLVTHTKKKYELYF